jgi:hypothetical protein
VPWGATRQYATTLPDSTLVCLPRADHVIYLHEPAMYLNLVMAFLGHAPLPGTCLDEAGTVPLGRRLLVDLCERSEASAS